MAAPDEDDEQYPYFTLVEKRKKRIITDEGQVDLTYEQSQAAFGDDLDARWDLYYWCCTNGDYIGFRATIMPRSVTDNRGNVKSMPSVTFGNQPAGPPGTRLTSTASGTRSGWRTSATILTAGRRQTGTGSSASTTCSGRSRRARWWRSTGPSRLPSATAARPGWPP